MGGGGSTSQTSWVSTTDKEWARAAGSAQIQAAKIAAEASTANTNTAINYLRDSNVTGRNLAQQNMYQGLSSLNRTSNQAYDVFASSMKDALASLKTNFGTAIAQFAPYQSEGMGALDKLSSMLGLPGKPSASYALANLNKPQNPTAPKAPNAPQMPLDLIAPKNPSLDDMKKNVTDDQINQYIQLNSRPIRGESSTSYTDYDMAVPGDKPIYLYTGAGSVPNSGVYGNDIKAGSGGWNTPGTTSYDGNFSRLDPIKNAVTDYLAKQQLQQATKAYEQDSQSYGMAQQLRQQEVDRINQQYAEQQAAYQQQLTQYQTDQQNYPQAQSEYDAKVAALQAQINAPVNPQDMQNTLESLPGYQFTKDQALGAVTNQAAARGIMGGQYLDQLQKTAKGLADQNYGTYLSQLAQSAGMGLQATGAVSDLYAQQGTSTAAAQQNLGSGLSSILQQLGLGTSQAYNSMGQGLLGQQMNLGNSLASLQSGLGDTLANAALASGQAAASSYLQQGQRFIPLTSTSSSSGGGIGDALGGVGSLLGAMKGFSSKILKTDKEKIDAELIVQELQNLPIETWKYIYSDTKHIGPYAEDFKKAFGVGDGKTISFIDAIGVLMTAVQHLSNKISEITAIKETK